MTNALVKNKGTPKLATPLRQDTILAEGDKVIAIGKGDCQAILHEQLIGESAGAPAG